MGVVDFKYLKERVGIDDVAYSLGYRIDRSAGVGKYVEMVPASSPTSLSLSAAWKHTRINTALMTVKRILMLPVFPWSLPARTCII